MIMPEKDGIDVLNDVLLTGIPAHIVLTSGYSDAYLRLAAGVAKFHESGRVSILKKPFRRNELIQLLRQLSETMVVENTPTSRGLFSKMKEMFS